MDLQWQRYIAREDDLKLQIECSRGFLVCEKKRHESRTHWKLRQKLQKDSCKKKSQSHSCQTEKTTKKLALSVFEIYILSNYKIASCRGSLSCNQYQTILFQ